MWSEYYSILDQFSKDSFSRIANKLLIENYVVKYVVNKKTSGYMINPDYRFIEDNFKLFQTYFEVLDIKIQIRSSAGVVQLYHRYDSNHINLTKQDTLYILVLRIIYDENREKITTKDIVVTSIGSIVDKLITMKIEKDKPYDYILKDRMSLFKSFNIIDKYEGEWKDAETRVIIYPSILYVLPNERIEEIYQMIQNIEDNRDEEDNTLNAALTIYSNDIGGGESGEET